MPTPLVKLVSNLFSAATAEYIAHLEVPLSKLSFMNVSHRKRILMLFKVSGGILGGDCIVCAHDTFSKLFM